MAITIGQSLDFFLDTLLKSSSKNLKLSDEVLEHYLLEEFATGAPAFFSDFTLNRLEDGGIIDDEIVKKSKMLQKKYLLVDSLKVWDASSIRKSEEWKEIMHLSDEIKELIDEKWTEEEIEYLKK